MEQNHPIPACQADPKWAALVDDRPIPMPRRRVKVSVIRDQANIPANRALVRDHASPNDPIISDSDEIDLADGNVFNSIPACDLTSRPHCTGVPKLAYFVDDRWEVVVRNEQTGRSIRDLFALSAETSLLRDHESPLDVPIKPDDSASFVSGPVFRTVRDVVDIEECGKSGCKPPKAHRYIIRIDRIRYTVAASSMTGIGLLELAGKTPARFMILQKLHGGELKRIGPDEVVDFTCPGIERFVTNPMDQTEG